MKIDTPDFSALAPMAPLFLCIIILFAAFMFLYRQQQEIKSEILVLQKTGPSNTSSTEAALSNSINENKERLMKLTQNFDNFVKFYFQSQAGGPSAGTPQAASQAGRQTSQQVRFEEPEAEEDQDDDDIVIEDDSES
jgi:hypothetical protein